MFQTTATKATAEHPAYSHYQAAMAAGSTLRARELAKELGITEGDLVACRQNIDTWQLRAPFHLLLAELKNVGEVMTITRNDQAVHETTGVYHNFQFAEARKTGLVLSDAIDLRLFIGQWHSGFHVVEKGRHSLQFFDKHGLAVHKIYRTDNTIADKWDALIAEYRDASPIIPVYLPTEESPVSKPPAAFDQASFADDWANLKDVHEYHGMLKKHGLSRTQALSLIGSQWATPLAQDSLAFVLTLAQERAADIMVFVGNPGCIQIYSGPVHKLLTQGPWFNVLDPKFNLHLRTDQITQAWVIERPSSDGVITSIEAFNASGDSIITLFGKRKPGQPELTLWRDIVQATKQQHPKEPSHAC
jgi:putative hemin transport protein